MRTASLPIRLLLPALLALAPGIHAQFRGGGGPAGQLIRQGKLEEALELYRKDIQANPDSPQANSGAGLVLDLMGKGAEARKYFQKAIDLAADPGAKAQAQRTMAMSYAFSGDCANAGKYEQMVIDYWKTREAAEPGNAFYQQGEMADEAGRVCIDAGDLDAAARWYKMGHELGLKEPNLSQDQKDLWEFRWEHAQARIAARRGNKAEAAQHVAAAKAILDKDDTLAHGQPRGQAQMQYFPYLTGYVAYYTGDYQAALADLQNASQNDPFIQCLIGMTYEKLGDKDKAMDAYTKAAATTGHNPPAAFARPFATKKLSK